VKNVDMTFYEHSWHWPMAWPVIPVYMDLVINYALIKLMCVFITQWIFVILQKKRFLFEAPLEMFLMTPAAVLTREVRAVIVKPKSKPCSATKCTMMK